MGITEIEALALILGGAFLVGSLYTRAVDDILQVVLLVGGLAMLIFGLLDIAVDHL
jgi:uncharacterized membrane protein YgdD (TMEM256/DUF423 family)